MPLDCLMPVPNEPRIGYGFDLHRLEAGRRLILAGIEVPHNRGCAAHSDGDVVLHAVTDAILGAIGQEDIGQLFPDDQAAWENADSSVFIHEAVRRMQQAGYRLGNVDIAVILQTPKLSPHKQAMRQRLAGLLGVDASQINLKGKTHEQVDAIGEGRAVACHTVALLLPCESG